MMDLALAATAGLVVVWVPGAVATRALRVARSDPIIRFAQEIALGLSFWPILFLFTTMAGVSWSANGARLVLLVGGCWLLADSRVSRLFIRNSTSNKQPATVNRKPDLVESAALALTAIVSFTRLRQIDDVVLPLWVDSVHHTMIVRLLVEHGRLPDSYAPFIPDSTFYYHWGFHAVVAFVAWISGLTEAAEVPRLLLGFGQLINVLIFFAVYCAGASLFRSRRTALLAAALATLVSIFPAYYVSWGRYTQLCGLLLLPPLASAFWKLGRHPSVRRGIEVAWLGGGLLLVHVRVAVVFAILASLLALLLALQRCWRGLAFCAVAGSLAILIAMPWIVHLARVPQVRMIMAPDASERGQWETSNAVPNDLVWVPHNTFLFALASGGLIGLTPFPLGLAARIVAIAWWAFLVVLLQRRARRRRGIARHDGSRMAIVVTWLVVTALLINLDRLGLPRPRILPNSAALIMLFLPLSLASAHLLRWSGDELVRPSRRRGLFFAAILVIGLAGASRILRIVNPVTVLATAADRRALDWIRAQTPPRAKFAVGVQPWIGGSYVGIDGGYWIPLVAERDSILPPGLYRWVMPRERVASITRSLAWWYEAEQTGNANVLDELRRQGVTHFYFGARNATPMRAAIASSPHMSRVYAEASVEIYALK